MGLGGCSRMAIRATPGLGARVQVMSETPPSPRGPFSVCSFVCTAISLPRCGRHTYRDGYCTHWIFFLRRGRGSPHCSAFPAVHREDSLDFFFSSGHGAAGTTHHHPRSPNFDFSRLGSPWRTAGASARHPAAALSRSKEERRRRPWFLEAKPNISALENSSLWKGLQTRHACRLGIRLEFEDDKRRSPAPGVGVPPAECREYSAHRDLFDPRGKSSSGGGTPVNRGRAGTPHPTTRDQACDSSGRSPGADCCSRIRLQPASPATTRAPHSSSTGPRGLTRCA